MLDEFEGDVMVQMRVRQSAKKRQPSFLFSWKRPKWAEFAKAGGSVIFIGIGPKGVPT